jgi:hypothetical protein
MRNFSGRSCRENQNTFLCSVALFFENRTVYEIMWKNVVEADRPQIAIRHERSVCWIRKATNTRSEYIIRTAFFTASVVSRTRFSITFIRILHVLFKDLKYVV